MSVKILEMIEDAGDGDVWLFIETVDGAGTQRIYRASIGSEKLAGRWLIGYRQLSGPEGARPHKTEAVRKTAKEAFTAAGYRVYGVDPEAVEAVEEADQ